MVPLSHALRGVTVPGSRRVPVKADHASVWFSGRLRGRQLPRGRYRLLVTVRNESGRSATRRVGFRVIGQQHPGPGYD